MHYLLIPYFCLVLFYLSGYEKRDTAAGQGILIFGCAVLALMLWAAIVFRPPLGDIWRYMQTYKQLSNISFPVLLATEKPEILFRVLTWLSGQFSSSSWVYLSLTFGLYFTVFLCAIKRVLSRTNCLVLFLVYSMYPYFIAYGASGIRQGLGLVFMLMGLVQLYHHRRSGWFWLLLTPFWHKGMWLAVAVIAALHLIPEDKRLRYSLYALGFFSLLSASGLNQQIGGLFSAFIDLDARYDIYFDDEVAKNINYKTGFRLDFFLFSLFPVLIWVSLRQQLVAEQLKMADYWLAIYIALNCLYHLFSFAPFADRFASFSWFILPLVILQTCLATRQTLWHNVYVIFFAGLNVLLLQFYTAKYLYL